MSMGMLNAYARCGCITESYGGKGHQRSCSQMLCMKAGLAIPKSNHSYPNPKVCIFIQYSESIKAFSVSPGWKSSFKETLSSSVFS